MRLFLINHLAAVSFAATEWRCTGTEQAGSPARPKATPSADFNPDYRRQPRALTSFAGVF